MLKESEMRLGQLSLEVGSSISARFDMFQYTNVEQWMVGISIFFISMALLFKLGAVPFHAWLPDVYEGAPTMVTAFFAIVPKITILMLTYRILSNFFPSHQEFWVPMFVAFGFLSTAVATFFALFQKRIKRMLAYSAIGHTGFMLFAIPAGSVIGVSNGMFYIILYMVGAFTMFSILLQTEQHNNTVIAHELSQTGNSENTGNYKSLERGEHNLRYLGDFSGALSRHPLLAFAIAMSFFSMAGIPPLAGFFSKFAIITIALYSEYYLLFVLIVVIAVITSVYYIRIIKLTSFDVEMSSSFKESGRWSHYQKDVTLLVTSLLFLLAFFIAPQATVFVPFFLSV